MTISRIGLRATGTTALWRVSFRGAAIAALLLVEIGALDQSYSFADAVAGETPPLWRAFNEALQILAYIALYAGAAFCALAFARGRAALTEWVEAAQSHQWVSWLAIQSALFLALLATSPLLQLGTREPPWIGFSIWLSGCAVMLGFAVMALAPFGFWRSFIKRHDAHIVAACVAGTLLHAAVVLSRDSWHILAGATLHSTYALLQLYEPGAVIDLSSRMLGANGFSVIIDAPCSGYEGIGLVLCLMSFYLFAFRQNLRFPLVLILLPIGALTIWLLNTVRLALLVSIGAHISPDIALNGFHSQAGWIFFLFVSISLMVIAHRAPVFRAIRTGPAQPKNDAVDLAAALLVPFAALMAARLIGPIFGAGQYWATASLIALPIAAIWFYRRRLAMEFGRIGIVPILIGLAVGVLWVATEAIPQEVSPLRDWLASQPPGSATFWLALRVFGFALIVPIAEELAFRGYLHRALSARAFETASPYAFNWLALIGASLLFGAMHGRWLAAALAGAAFALALYRSRSLLGPIAAHVAANYVIAVAAIAMQRWDLL